MLFPFWQKIILLRKKWEIYRFLPEIYPWFFPSVASDSFQHDTLIFNSLESIFGERTIRPVYHLGNCNWQYWQSSLKYLLICDGVYDYLCCFVLTTTCISWENREIQSSTLPGKSLFIGKLQKEYNFFTWDAYKDLFLLSYPKDNFL